MTERHRSTPQSLPPDRSILDGAGDVWTVESSPAACGKCTCLYSSHPQGSRQEAQPCG